MPKDPTAAERQRRRVTDKRMAAMIAALRDEGMSEYATLILAGLREGLEEQNDRITRLEHSGAETGRHAILKVRRPKVSVEAAVASPQGSKKAKQGRV